MDTHKTFFTGRHLYVGASRVTSSEYLHVASRGNAGWIRDKLQEVPLDQKKEPDRADVETAEDGMDQIPRDRLSSIFGEDLEMWDE